MSWHFQVCFYSQGQWRPSGRTRTWKIRREEREAKKRVFDLRLWRWERTSSVLFCLDSQTHMECFVSLGPREITIKWNTARKGLLGTQRIRALYWRWNKCETGVSQHVGDRQLLHAEEELESHWVAAVEGRTKTGLEKVARWQIRKNSLSRPTQPWNSLCHKAANSLPWEYSSESCKWTCLPSEDSCFAEGLT